MIQKLVYVIVKAVGQVKCVQIDVHSVFGVRIAVSRAIVITVLLAITLPAFVNANQDSPVIGVWMCVRKAHSVKIVHRCVPVKMGPRVPTMMAGVRVRPAGEDVYAIKEYAMKVVGVHNVTKCVNVIRIIRNYAIHGRENAIVNQDGIVTIVLDYVHILRMVKIVMVCVNARIRPNVHR